MLGQCHIYHVIELKNSIIMYISYYMMVLLNLQVTNNLMRNGARFFGIKFLAPLLMRMMVFEVDG
jgi:hypothetical protein